MENLYLSFPPNSIAENAIRLDAQAIPGEIIAINKPAGTPAEKIVAEINKRIAEKQPSFCALALERAYLVYACEPEISGLMLVAGTQTYARWRDALGSNLFNFHFEFLSKRVPAIENEFYCDLPVAKHFNDECAVISSTTGKKSRTQFKRIATGTTFEKWEATTTFPRFHQIRIHAFECEIPVVADPIYDGVPAPTIASLRPKKRLNKGEDKAFYPNICLHLARIETTLDGNAFVFSAPTPKGLATLEKKLGL